MLSVTTDRIFAHHCRSFDDIEDGSELRRGFPATHTVFGIPQSINSATFAVLQTLRKAQSLDIPNALNITLGTPFQRSIEMVPNVANSG